MGMNIATSKAGTAALAEDTAIRPFRIDVPEEAIADPRRPIAATRWPESGHFAAWEEPELFSAELREAFRSLR